MSDYLTHRRNLKLGIVQPEKKVLTPIAKKSDKRKALQKEYVALVKSMLAVNPMCEIKIKGVCTGRAGGLHHKQKRTPKNMLEPTNLLRACNNCNSWLEQYPLEAIKLGFSISKHVKK